MEFNIQSALQILERTPFVIEAMLQDLDEQWTHTNEGGNSWSAFDIVGHYIHGEKTDWVPRMNIILSDDAKKDFVPFDRFAQFSDTKGKTLDQLLNEFKVFRAKNIEQLKLKGLTEDLLNRTGVHPTFGNVTLRQLLSAWVVHDLTHIYQISRVMAKQYEIEVGPWKEFLGVLK
jgi:hypothetical protein